MKTYLLVIIILMHSKYIECDTDIQNDNSEIITNRAGNDGFGAQFQNIIDTAIYAELNNKKFVYTPFKTMEHNYNSDKSFLEKKELLINFIGNFEINENHTINIQVDCHDYFDKNVDKCTKSLSLNKIKKIFRANKNILNYFNNKNLNIALHIRRPNPHDSRIYGTDTPDNVFVNIVNKLRNLYVAKNPLFHLYSQGNIENFKIFNSPDIILHLNESVEDSFTSMVLADVLVTSASSFSYTAGLLSEGIVYYVPFWHSPLPNWIKVDIN